MLYIVECETVSGTTKVSPSPCAPGDDPCIKIISGKGTDTGQLKFMFTIVIISDTECFD